ncbi:MAG: EAL domain-containing protein [Gammaproteobacteria bacterium]|nr:MAG: EAL domain-containing protein [Gammaproteobacteria bacterium]
MAPMSLQAACTRLAHDHLTHLLSTAGLPAWFNSPEECEAAVQAIVQELLHVHSAPFDTLFDHFQQVGKKLQRGHAPPVAVLLERTQALCDDMDRMARLDLIEDGQVPSGSRMQEARLGLLRGALQSQANSARPLFRTDEDMDWEMDITRHREWYQTLLSALASPGDDSMPDCALAHCDFTDWTQSLEYQMLVQCLTPGSREALLILHQKLHEQAGFLDHALRTRQMADALLGFTELQKTYALLESRLKEAYVVFQTDKTSQFFRFFADTLILEDNLSYFLSVVIDLRNMGKRNGSLRRALVEIYRQIKSAPFVHNQIAGVIESGTSLHLLYRYQHPEDIKRVLSNLRRATSEVHTAMQDLFAPRFNIRALDTARLGGMSVNALRMLAGELQRYQPDMPVKLFDSGEAVALRERIEEGGQILDAVIHAIEHQTLELYFQPIVRITDATRELAYCEALARIHYNGELIEAERFIHTVRDRGLSPMLDAAVLNQLTRLAPEIRKHLNNVSCNLFPNSLDQSQVMSALEHCLARFRELDLTLTLEITEYELFHRFDTLNALYQAHPHFRVALDDFGSGYSSLATVTALRNAGLVDTLKLDGSLSDNLEDQPLNQQVVFLALELAGHLGLEVVIEHIHTPEAEQVLLERENAFMGQGHLYGKAMPLEGLESVS